MKALVKYLAGPGNVEIREVPEPRCGDDQVILEVTYCGICGTDLHVYDDKFRNFPPVILGHEISGTVVERGPAVRSVRPGDKIAVLGATTVTCGRCCYCRAGQFMFCRERRGMGHGVDGGFARFLAAREDQAYVLPGNATLEDGAICEPFASAVHAVLEVTDPAPKGVVLISGPGPIGLLCLKLLVREGVKTIVAGADSDASRLEMAMRLGAHRAVNVGRESLMEIARDESDGFGVDVAFECAGAAASAQNCLDALRPLGQYTQIAHFGREVTVNLDRIGFKQLRFSGSVGYTHRTWARVMEILKEGKITLADLVSHRLPLERWREGFDLCANKQAVKVLLSP